MGLNLKGIGKAFSKVSEDYIPAAGKTLSKVKDTAVKKASSNTIKDTGIGIGGGAIAGGIVAGIDGNDDTSIIEGATVGGIIGGIGGAIYGNRSRIASKFSKNASASTAEAAKVAQEAEDTAKNLNIAKNISKTKAGQYSGINETVSSNLNTAENVAKTEAPRSEGLRFVDPSNKEEWDQEMRRTVRKELLSHPKQVTRDIGYNPEKWSKWKDRYYPKKTTTIGDLSKNEQMLRQAVKKNALQGEFAGQTTLLDWQDQISMQS